MVCKHVFKLRGCDCFSRQLNKSALMSGLIEKVSQLSYRIAAGWSRERGPSEHGAPFLDRRYSSFSGNCPPFQLQR